MNISDSKLCERFMCTYIHPYNCILTPSSRQPHVPSVCGNKQCEVPKSKPLGSARHREIDPHGPGTSKGQTAHISAITG